MRETAVYKDVNQFTPTKRPYSTDARAVYQSVINIIRMSFNAIPFSTLGVNLEEELFELYNQSDAEGLLVRLTAAIEERDSRVTIDASQSAIEIIPNTNRLKIDLIFEIEGIVDQQFAIQEEIAF